MLGNLTWAAIPFDEPIPLYTAGVVGLAIVAILAWITLKGWLPYLWRSGSPASTTSGSASCTACSPGSCCCEASPTRS